MRTHEHCLEQVIPAVVIDRVRGFAINRDVDGLAAVEAMPRLGIQFDNPDEAEVSPVRDPQAAIRGIEQEPRINGVAVLDTVDEATMVLSLNR